MSCSRKSRVDVDHFYFVEPLENTVLLKEVKTPANGRLPSFKTYTNEVKLVFEADSSIYNEGKRKSIYFKDDKVIEGSNKIVFEKKNKNYHWIYRNKRYDTIPFRFKRNVWYVLRDLRIDSQEYYMYFKFDENLESESRLEPVVRSPI
jgi:hypothetical protein